MLTLALLQGIDLRAADFIQYLIGIAIVAWITLSLKMALDLNTIKTVLLNPDNGLTAEVAKLRNYVHDLSNLQTSVGFAINRLEEKAGLELTEGLQPRRRSDSI